MAARRRRAAPDRRPGRVARGRAIFAERIVGTIANRQIFKRAPRAYAAAKIEGPVLAPIDADAAARREAAVRCADCHSAAPLETRAAAGGEPAAAGPLHALPRGAREARRAAPRRPRPPAGELDPELDAGAASGRSRRRRWRSARMPRRPPRLRAAGLVVEPAVSVRRGRRRRRAGESGRRPARRRHRHRAAARVRRPGHPAAVRGRRRGDQRSRAARTRRARAHRRELGARGAARRRCARPRPTCTTARCRRCARCWSPPRAARSASRSGAAGFVLDTRVPGNGNQGHEFGTALSAADKQDLIAFLETL